MYSCPTCGAGLVFDPKSQQLLCLSCRNKFDPENIEKMRLDQAKEMQKKEELNNENKEYEAISYKCSHCGAELITTDETITTFCSFCRTGTMLDRKIVKKRKPDFIIPFKITKEECEDIYIKKIKKSIFAPKDMIEEQEVKKIRGIYMPYWIYNFERHGLENAKGSKYSYSSGDYDYYDDYLLTTKIDAECNGITHDATSNFSDRLSEAIAPYSVKEKKDFSPAYFSGYYADNEDVDNEIYLEESRKIASNYITNRLGNEKEYRRYHAKPNVKLDEESAKLALFPVYFLATKNKNNDRISYAVVNGQTGKIAADIPVDFKKFAIFSLILSVIIFIILNFFLTITMRSLIILSIAFNIISLSILIAQNIKIKKIENQTDDKGLNFKKTVEKENAKEKHGFDFGIYKPIIGLIITFAIYFLNPAEDIYYYNSALISIGFTIWSFYNIIKKANILTTRKLPQLEKRGGDENA